VHVPPSLKQTLAHLREQTAGATALVSGRELAVLDRLFAPLTLAAIGCHGAEWRPHPHDAIEMRSPPLSDEIRQALLAIVAHEPQIRVEDKRCTLAFHYRAAPERGPELKERLTRCLEPFASGLRLLHGKLVLEVKPSGFDKGEAIRLLMREAPFAGRRPVFLGDDATDEDAFAAARQMGGIGISVGRSMADAQSMLPDPAAARAWLAALVS
jgi:trehalose 6-phosphate phosphatase